MVGMTLPSTKLHGNTLHKTRSAYSPTCELQIVVVFGANIYILQFNIVATVLREIHYVTPRHPRPLKIGTFTLSRPQQYQRGCRVNLTFRHRSFTFNSNKSPTWCNYFSVYYPDACLQLNMFRAFSRPSSGAQWLKWQLLVLPSYRGDSRAVFVVGRWLSHNSSRQRQTCVKPEAVITVKKLLMMSDNIARNMLSSQGTMD
jgi:hypothetical protein